MFDQTTYPAPTHSEIGRAPAYASARATDLIKDPIDLVLERYAFPFPPKPHQADTVNKYGKLDRHGYGWKPGCMKTMGTTLHACYLNSVKATKQWIILVPPIVLRNWSRFLEKVIDRSTGKPVTQTLYAGTPQEREALSLATQFIMMSYDIFKRDFDKLEAHFVDRKVGLIADEAHKIKNMETDNYKYVKKMFDNRPMLLATGTPITSPDDAYTYMEFTNSKAYYSKRHFEQLHVGERDGYEKVSKWVNLDVLQKNFLVNWTMYRSEDIRSDDQPVTFIPIVYDLAPAHLKLYDQMVEDQMLEFDDGRVIDAISATALYHKCQQIVCNWDVFSQNETCQSAGIELVEEVLDEIGSEKLMVVANYRMTNATLLRRLEPYGAVQIVGGLTDKQRNASLDRFIGNPTCRVLIIQPEAGGVGLDGLQHVCNEGIFLECPTIPRQFEQAYARLAREGQKRQVNWRIAVANKTIQVKLHRDLLNKDATVVKVTGGIKTLREAIHGT